MGHSIFIRTPPPIEGPGFLRGKRGVSKGRFCGGNCVSVFDLLINSEGGCVSALLFLGGQKFSFLRGGNMKTFNRGGGCRLKME